MCVVATMYSRGGLSCLPSQRTAASSAKVQPPMKKTWVGLGLGLGLEIGLGLGLGLGLG